MVTTKILIKILDTIKNFAPNLVIFGHVYNIESKIFEYCKNNNIKQQIGLLILFQMNF